MTATTPPGFQHLHLSPAILSALGRRGHQQPTAIQSQAIPAVLNRRDVFGCAQTGTGKTAAFVLPILQRLQARARPPGESIFSLILSPTRELATQIGENIAAYGADLPYRHAIFYGGVPKGPQLRMLYRGLDILVATPGRLLDIGTDHLIDFSKTEIVVLDEADRMLDMGFVEPVRQILGVLPRQRQTLFFSATVGNDVGRLAREILRDPLHIDVTPPASTPDLIEQCVYFLNDENEFRLLVELLRDPSVTRALIFVQTKFGARGLANGLSNIGLPAGALFGGIPQSIREQNLADFKAGRIRILVATDVAARGLDIPDVSHVFNTSVPPAPEDYVHRIGRTARAGKRGKAITFCNRRELRALKFIERLIGREIPSIDYFP